LTNKKANKAIPNNYEVWLFALFKIDIIVIIKKIIYNIIEIGNCKMRKEKIL